MDLDLLKMCVDISSILDANLTSHSYCLVSSHSFTVLAFIFLSSLLAHLIEVLLTRGLIQTWIYEQQLWKMKTVTSLLCGCLEAITKKIGIRESNFQLTNKAFEDEQVKLYQLGLLDFRTPNMLLVLLVTFTNLNMISFLGGLARVIVTGNWEDMKGKGRIPPSASQISTLYYLIFLVLGHYCTVRINSKPICLLMKKVKDFKLFVRSFGPILFFNILSSFYST
ncbi:Cellulose synthase [Dillenia turbinata]|uniref:Cellulose synthase n=1 Tax=Dillenia turbinata TaxID=194707 RepID=A0AAN8VH50_9MAGN